MAQITRLLLLWLLYEVRDTSRLSSRGVSNRQELAMETKGYFFH